jgi:hypothetical protein
MPQPRTVGDLFVGAVSFQHNWRWLTPAGSFFGPSQLATFVTASAVPVLAVSRGGRRDRSTRHLQAGARV